MSSVIRRPLMCLIMLALTGVYGCSSSEELVSDPVTHKIISAPAMTPWRDPIGDMARFFPGASDYSQDTLILSPYRLEILKRLGSGISLDSNTLYAYRVRRQGKVVGTILIRSAPGEYGAIETVLAVSPERRIVGIHIQRNREPSPIIAALTDAQWLQSFQGKDAKSLFQPGKDLSEVPEAAQRSALAVATVVRSLLIEYDVVESYHP